MADLTALPRDLLSTISTNLRYEDIQNLCRTNRSLANTCKSNQFWQGLIAQKYPMYINDSNYNQNPEALFELLDRSYFVTITSSTQPKPLVIVNDDIEPINGALFAYFDTVRFDIPKNKRSINAVGPGNNELSYTAMTEVWRNVIAFENFATTRGSELEGLSQKGLKLYAFKLVFPSGSNRHSSIFHDVSPKFIQSAMRVYTYLGIIPVLKEFNNSIFGPRWN